MVAVNDAGSSVPSATITATPEDSTPPGSTTIEVRVNHDDDDAEEDTTTNILNVDTGSSDLELTEDGTEQEIGIRFNDVAIPQGAVIEDAYIQFTVDETDDVETNLEIFGEDIGNSARFVSTINNDISSRTKTSSSVSWSPAPWNNSGDAGIDQRTPNIASIIQEIVNLSSSSNTVIFEDDFNRSNSNTVGNGWTENDSGSGAEAKISNNRISFDSSDNSNQPCVVHSFATQNSGSLEWSYLFDFERTGSESNYGVYMDIGNNLTCSSTPGGSTAVELVWASPSYGMDDHEGFGYNTDSGETQVAVVSGEQTISVVANLDDATFDLDVGGNTANDVDFTNDVDVNTVRFYLDNVSDGNFGDLEIDDVSLTTNTIGWESGNSLSIIITGEGKRTAHSYDGSSSGAPLLVVTYSFEATVPGIPTNLSATPGNAEVSLSWSAPSNGGSQISSYVVEYSEGGTFDPANFESETVPGNPPATEITIDELTNNQAYTFRVSAVNGEGSGNPSATVTATPVSDVTLPGAPTNLTASPGNTEVALSWNAPNSSDGLYVTDKDNHRIQVFNSAGVYQFQFGSDGEGNGEFDKPTGLALVQSAGGDVTDYVIEYRSGSVWNTFADGTSTDTTTTVTGLRNGVEYEFRVSAVNTAGTGPESNIATATPSSGVTVAVQISQSSDDAEQDDQNEDGNSVMELTSSDMDLDDSDYVGLRFNGINIPQGATIENAYVEFTSEENESGSSSVTIHGQLISDAPTFTTTSNDITSRTTTSASVSWNNIGTWSEDEISDDTRTPNIATIIQEIINLSGTGQNLVVNGGFESPTVTANGGTWELFPDGTTGLGWTVTGADIEIQRGVVTAADEGQQSAELDSTTNTTISQTISTVSGQTYTLSFASMARPGTDASTNGLQVTWNGVDVSPGLSLGNSWETTTVQVTGTGSDVLSFVGSGTPDGLGTFVDDVSLTGTVGWESGNSVVLIFEASSQSNDRDAYSYDGNSSEAPRLYITYSAEASTPGAPTNLTAESGDTEVLLSWAPPANNGGSAITDYILEYNDGTNGWQVFNDGTSIDTTDVPVTGLANGQPYDFMVSAVNAEGTGPTSNEATATPAGVPDAPVITEALGGNLQVLLTWTVPANNGAAIDHYEVQYKESSDATWSDGGTTTSNTSFPVPDLENGVSYDFRVRAVNSAGDGPYSTPASATPSSTATAPFLHTLTPGNAEVFVDWDAPGDDGGSDITAYHVQYSTDGTFDVNTPFKLVSGNPPLTETTVTGLTNGQQYTFRVVAINANGPSTPSNLANATPATIPSAPVIDPAQTVTGNEFVTIGWSTPYDGGSPITHYVIQAKPASGSWETVEDDHDVSNPNVITIQNLANGVEYSFQVAAVNGVDQGPYSPIELATPGDVPAQIDDLTVERGDEQVLLTWSAPNNHGFPITDYVIEVDYGDGNGFVVYNDGQSIDTTDVPVTGLENGVLHKFIVYAQNALGDATPSDEVEATPARAPDAPVITELNPGDGQIEVSGQHQ